MPKDYYFAVIIEIIKVFHFEILKKKPQITSYLFICETYMLIFRSLSCPVSEKRTTIQ